MKEEGFEAEIIRMSSTVAAAALASGEADYVTGMSAIREAIQGLPRLCLNGRGTRLEDVPK